MRRKDSSQSNPILRIQNEMTWRSSVSRCWFVVVIVVVALSSSSAAAAAILLLSFPAERRNERTDVPLTYECVGGLPIDCLSLTTPLQLFLINDIDDDINDNWPNKKWRQETSLWDQSDPFLCWEFCIPCCQQSGRKKRLTDHCFRVPPFGCAHGFGCSVIGGKMIPRTQR